MHGGHLNKEHEVETVDGRMIMLQYFPSEEQTEITGVERTPILLQYGKTPVTNVEMLPEIFTFQVFS